MIGWDIGGVNLKAARIEDEVVACARSVPFSIEHELPRLPEALRSLAVSLGGGDSSTHALTMTAELSQRFTTKREGVSAILDAMDRAFPSAEIQVLTSTGELWPLEEARRSPLLVAAANWMATALYVSHLFSDVLLVDVGSTTADIVPIVNAAVAAKGRTDLERLAAGELIYTGAVRTPAEAIVTHVDIAGIRTGVSAEAFALSGDAHLWLGAIASSDYTTPTPDGRPPSRLSAALRLARVICADREQLTDDDLTGIALQLRDAQVARIAEGIGRVCARHPHLEHTVVTGLGEFLAVDAAAANGLRTESLADRLGSDASRIAPAAALGLIASGRSIRRTIQSQQTRSAGEGRARSAVVDTVVKIGGGLLGQPGALERVSASLTQAAQSSDAPRFLIVPGGGPFADSVRTTGDRLEIGQTTSHWMAVLAMDQMAWLLADRIPGTELIDDPMHIQRVLNARRMPVIAPYEWLRQVDRLPHSWDVTSDSIAAWIAEQIGASDLVLIKPIVKAPMELVDEALRQRWPPGVSVTIASPSALGPLEQVLGRTVGSGYRA